MGAAVREIQKRTNVRYVILTILFIVTAVNYIDRSIISLAVPTLKKELVIDSVLMGVILSGFSWAYVVMQIPGGWLLDRFGTRRVYGVGLLVWSVCTLLQGFATSFLVLLILRVLLGLAEAPSFPGNSRLTTMWFPQQERGRAVMIYNSAQYFGLALFTPVMAWILTKFGWHSMFSVAGIAGIVLAVIWFIFVRDPQDHPRVNQAEIDHIVEGGGLANVQGQEKVTWAHVRFLLTNRQMIGIYIAQFALNTIVYFFLTWFPTYLVQTRHMSILKAGFMTSITYLAAFVGGIVGGYISDLLLKSGKSLGVARKTPIIIGFLLSSVIVLANFVNSTIAVVLIMATSVFAKGMAGLTWSLVGDMAPKKLIGFSGGLFNTAGNLAGIVIPLLVGYILNTTHSFNGVFIFIAVVVIVAALCYLFVVRPVERLEVPEESPLGSNPVHVGS
ncbi:MFS transporter [Alicyclobacillus macrosporangiidus]|uniref:MFS transporter, ACS family, glucarate transporter n=1 Tax=Alicyclobacillus macrosporangiidus TaxID=392015 RepID=A0A1I7GDG5_9BACL|nr:MFS transporter [Alicyclobacillus macrosporangiidus]SFU46463.1 MFS transporter, ACS family, glucarate transporter [Alicyclobacillus macrosporangiidus]